MEKVRWLGRHLGKVLSKKKHAIVIALASSVLSCTSKPAAIANPQLRQFERDLQKWYRTINH